MVDQRKLETLFRLGCPDAQIIQLLKTGTFTPTGDQLLDDTLESLIDHKTFNNNNWGGIRQGAGAPKGNTNAIKNNQDSIKNNQDCSKNNKKTIKNNQDFNQDFNQDADKDILNNKNNNSRIDILNNNSRVDVCLLDTTRTHARGKTVEDILQETNNGLSSRKVDSVVITSDFVFPNDMFFNAYRQELPTATAKTEQWLRKSNLVGKMVGRQKLAQIIRKFAM